MKHIESFLKIPIFQVLNNEITLEEFEQWVYANPELKTVLGEDDYIDLISFNFKQKDAKYDLSKILKRNIDTQEFETYKILKLLQDTLQKKESVPFLLLEILDFYHNGYTFLYRLIGYAYQIEEIAEEEVWEQIAQETQKQILAKFYPELDDDLNQVIRWINEKKIILEGRKDETSYLLTFQDFRQEDEKPENGFYYYPIEQPKWYEFWKNQDMNAFLMKIIIILALLSLYNVLLSSHVKK